MKNNIELIQSGLKCDNPTCDWEDMSIAHTDYERFVNTPCPKCGENILTEEDYNMALLFHSVVDAVNGMSQEELDAIRFEDLGDISLFSAEDNKKLKEGEDKNFRVQVDLHNGIKFEIKDNE